MLASGADVNQIILTKHGYPHDKSRSNPLGPIKFQEKNCRPGPSDVPLVVCRVMRRVRLLINVDECNDFEYDRLHVDDDALQVPTIHVSTSAWAS